jgi:transposase
MIDARLVPDEQEGLTPGEAVAGMALNGLGFANRPLSLPPQFFTQKPLDLLFRQGVRAERFNRFTLGRTLEEVHTYGGDLLLSDIALAVCAHAGIDLRFNHLDTTSFAVTGAYVPESDAQALTITHGHAKDHRPDVQQAVLALMVSQDGGVPFVRKRWEGNTSDTHIFQERAQALMTTLQTSPTPRYLVADSTLYNEDNAANLQAFGFITRIPNTLKLVSQVITQALRWDTWQPLDAGPRSQRVAFCHYKMAQRWLVVCSQAACERAEATVTKAQQRAAEAIDTQLLHLQAQRFETSRAATAALAALATPWRYHQVDASSLVEHKRYACKGRPTSTTPLKAVEWQILGQVQPDEGQLASLKQAQACCVLGTNIDASQGSDLEVIQADKSQAQAAGGFRFLKDPLFFVSSLFVKKPSRMQGLLTVLTCALLVYSVAQRRLRPQ